MEYPFSKSEFDKVICNSDKISFITLTKLSKKIAAVIGIAAFVIAIVVIIEIDRTPMTL